MNNVTLNNEKSFPAHEKQKIDYGRQIHIGIMILEDRCVGQ